MPEPTRLKVSYCACTQIGVNWAVLILYSECEQSNKKWLGSNPKVGVHKRALPQTQTSGSYFGKWTACLEKALTWWFLLSSDNHTGFQPSLHHCSFSQSYFSVSIVLSCLNRLSCHRLLPVPLTECSVVVALRWLARAVARFRLASISKWMFTR